METNLVFFVIIDLNLFKSISPFVFIGNTVIFPSGEISIIEKVRDLGCNVIQVGVSEFIKAGGAGQCLVISLDYYEVFI